VVYPATGTRVVYPVTTVNSGVLNQPPPPYEPSVKVIFKTYIKVEFLVIVFKLICIL
jgi:hypothetical protein